MAKIPDKVGKYKILSQIGKGGMGVVYAARHPTLKRKIILKKLTIRDKEFKERFRLEADMMMDLRSDYIVDIYDHFREGSSWYIAMEYIEGITLEELIRREGALDLPVLYYIMLGTSKALEYIHNKGIVHRDIKPANIFISNEGDVKIGDFGIASSTGRDVKITDAGSAMGTPAYMAPEQFDDSSSVGIKADLFSFGVTFYEALCGVKPFRSESYTALKKEIRKGRYASPAILRKKIPLSLKFLIRRSLIVYPGLRPRNAAFFRKILEKKLGRKQPELIRNQLSESVLGGKKPSKAVMTRLPETSPVKGKKRVLALTLLISFFGILIMAGFYTVSTRGILHLALIPSLNDSIFTVYSYGGNIEKQGYLNSKGTGNLLLKEGSYRIRIESGSTISWRSAYVSTLLKRRGVLNVTVLSGQAEALPLNLDISVKDRFTGRSLMETAQIYLKDKDDWIETSPEILEKLTSGIDLQIKISAEGYRDEIFTLNPAYHQTLIDLDVLLTPVPAVLTITGKDRGSILINQSEKYFSPLNLMFQKIPEKEDKPLSLSLLPGTYSISFRTPEGTLEREITLRSGRKYNFP